MMSRPSSFPLPDINSLITLFNQLYISMPSHDSSAKNVVDPILDQPWRSPTNPITGEVIPYRTEDAPSTTNQDSPTPAASSTNSHIQILERKILALSPPPPSQPVTPIVHHSTPPLEEEAQAQTSPTESSKDDEEDFPIGEGWFRNKPGVHTTNLMIPPDHNDEEMVSTKYLKFTINYSGEPTIEATMG
jgi:hypothetical protein